MSYSKRLLLAVVSVCAFSMGPAKAMDSASMSYPKIFQDAVYDKKSKLLDVSIRGVFLGSDGKVLCDITERKHYFLKGQYVNEITEVPLICNGTLTVVRVKIEADDPGLDPAYWHILVLPPPKQK